jgi:hypothetical protein
MSEEGCNGSSFGRDFSSGEWEDDGSGICFSAGNGVTTTLGAQALNSNIPATSIP